MLAFIRFLFAGLLAGESATPLPPRFRTNTARLHSKKRHNGLWCWNSRSPMRWPPWTSARSVLPTITMQNASCPNACAPETVAVRRNARAAEPGSHCRSETRPDHCRQPVAMRGFTSPCQQIAPVLLLKSRNETYAENLQSAAIIGEMVGKKREMQARLEQHKERMAQWASQLPKGHAWPLAHHANSNSTCILRRPGPAACWPLWG
ncbi:iron-dicitrate transporter substrate-binding subunit [Escherichia coli]|uniref:Iron-dicitrate transporter substrate-binding subunit n=1 Tax=Escherichia coli TaxID=562 RepID=A0A2X1N7P2_ECOLX|nr:iron-dicitrate transporter substrate-binding subunit [Escherichia coli]